MKALQLAIALALAAIPVSAIEPSPGDQKPAPQKKPEEKVEKKNPGKKAHSTPKAQPSRKDLAVKEARGCDRDKDNQIDGLELMELNNLLKSNPESYLYLFDQDENHSFDSKEVAAINKALKPKKK